MAEDGKDFLVRALRKTPRFVTPKPPEGAANQSLRAPAHASIEKSNGTTSGGQGSKKAEKAAEQFEALLLQQMFQSMWKSVSSEGMLSGSREEEHFRDMLNEGLATEIARGQGIGIKDVLLRDMQGLEARNRVHPSGLRRNGAKGESSQS